tara:strand:+ start:1059 stop:1535 length:477 start_codon:yes stop_codon:yes gene_type:complete
MRKVFSNILHDYMAIADNIVVIVGDLGYGLWDKIRIDYADRFYNVGSSENLMVGTAIGMAMENKIPIVYSITPFLLYRPFEMIRNYIDHESIPVKLVGGGRDKDYGYLGFSHWGHDDKRIMSCFDNVIKSHPEDEEELRDNFEQFLFNEKPYYLNLKR